LATSASFFSVTEKVHYHYKTVNPETNVTIDDSKVLGPDKPMELIIGKKFKLEVWENCLQTMWLNEVSKFKVKKEASFSRL
jgi:AH receptor-interacting protein